MVRRRVALIVVALLALSACSGNAFVRSDAIAGLATTGLSEVESTCVADTLVALGELTAADPRHRRGDAEREVLVTATNRCVAPEPIVSSSPSPSQERVAEDDDPEGTVLDESRLSTTGEDQVERRSLAIAHLELAGRSGENARCVVDRLIATEAEAVFADPAFGLGLDPLEADAFAACI
jgi:hypothetical protein